jgi:hypothetical protein
MLDSYFQISNWTFSSEMSFVHWSDLEEDADVAQWRLHDTCNIVYTHQGFESLHRLIIIFSIFAFLIRKSQIWKVRVIVGILLIMVSCNVAPEKSQSTYQYVIDERLQCYVESFFLEAKTRGILLKEENLIVLITDSIPIDNAIGISLEDSLGQRFVGIHSEFYLIYSYRKFQMEMVVFHELGHAFLKREHNNHYSIMNTKAPSSIYAYDSIKRKLLLHELFLGDTVNIFDLK